MNAKRHAMTRVDVLIVVLACAAGFLWLLVLPLLARPREGQQWPHSCKGVVELLGKAMVAYREDNGGYFPFSWQRAGEAEPTGAGNAQAAMAATSLGNLYPRYIQTARSFRCGSTEDQPSFLLNLLLEFRSAAVPASFREKLPQGSNWTVHNSSYGYDPRLSPRVAGNQAVLADMYGSWQANHDTSTQNHCEGQNVLYVDGHVAWQQTNFCSTDLSDNIFAEDTWDADTDTYLLSKDAGLGISFDGYKHLHYPQKGRP